MRRYLDALRGRLRRSLGDDLVAVYLHGSAAIGGFVPGRSDIDVLVVSARSLGAENKRAAAEALSEGALPCPGSGLELSLVTEAVARAPARRTPFELHLDSFHGRVVDGAGHPGDTDLPVVFEMVRQRGTALAGPPPTDLLGPLPRSWLIECHLEDARWAQENAPPHYRVLNACRSWRFLEDGRLCSKVEAAAWARPRSEMPEVIDAALELRASGRGVLEERAVRALTEPIVEALRAALP